jgi:hypothetical protein
MDEAQFPACWRKSGLYSIPSVVNGLLARAQSFSVPLIARRPDFGWIILMGYSRRSTAYLSISLCKLR